MPPIRVPPRHRKRCTLRRSTRSCSRRVGCARLCLRRRSSPSPTPNPRSRVAACGYALQGVVVLFIKVLIMPRYNAQRFTIYVLCCDHNGRDSKARITMHSAPVHRPAGRVDQVRSDLGAGPGGQAREGGEREAGTPCNPQHCRKTVLRFPVAGFWNPAELSS